MVDAGHLLANSISKQTLASVAHVGAVRERKRGKAQSIGIFKKTCPESFK